MPSADGLISHEQLLRILRYDPSTGAFTRLTESCRGRWKTGDIAGGVSKRGYRSIKIDGKQYKAHRLAWFYMTGEWPARGIDHEHGHPDDNRWGHIREANQTQNNANTKRRRDNSSGYKGVSFKPKLGKWIAQITCNSKGMHIGVFNTPEQAHEAYMAKAKELFGEFARAA